MEDDYYGASLNMVNSVHRIGQQATVNVIINNKSIKMIYDPGFMFTVTSGTIWKKIGSPQLRPVPKLEAYIHVEIETSSITEVVVRAFLLKHKLQLTVIKQDDVPFFRFGLVHGVQTSTTTGSANQTTHCKNSNSKINLKK